MGKTVRKVDPRTARWAGSYDDKRKAHMLLKGVKTFRSGACGSAVVDNEGNHKLNNWDTCPTKSKNNTANRGIRRAGKVQVRRQLEQLA